MIEKINRLLADAATDPHLRERLRNGDIKVVLREYGLHGTSLIQLTGPQSVQSLAYAASLANQAQAAEPSTPPSASDGLRPLANAESGAGEQFAAVDNAAAPVSPSGERNRSRVGSVASASRP